MLARILEQSAHWVAVALTENDALAAHLSAELDIDEDDVVGPWHAAASTYGVGLLLGASGVV